jgi:hypothetical protein
MPGRRVFFSFHYEGDIWRATVVRNTGIVDAIARVGWTDASLWEKAKREGKAEIQRLIDNGLKQTSVTAVLIGTDTASRDWVNYEIKQSISRGNGLFGVYIDRIGDQQGTRSKRGPIPQLLSDRGYKVYVWNRDKFRPMVERAALDADKACLAHDTKHCLSCRLNNWWQLP